MVVVSFAWKLIVTPVVVAKSIRKRKGKINLFFLVMGRVCDIDSPEFADFLHDSAFSFPLLIWKISAATTTTAFLITEGLMIHVSSSCQHIPVPAISASQFVNCYT